MIACCYTRSLLFTCAAANVHRFVAEHYPRILLSRDRYENEPLLRAKKNNLSIIVCGEKFGGVDVVCTLYQRGYSAVLLRGSSLHFDEFKSTTFLINI